MSVKLKGALLVSWVTERLNIIYCWVSGSDLGDQAVKVPEAKLCGCNFVYPASQRLHHWSHAGEPWPSSQSSLIALDPASMACLLHLFRHHINPAAKPGNKLKPHIRVFFFLTSAFPDKWHFPQITWQNSKKCIPPLRSFLPLHITSIANWQRAKGPTYCTSV